MRLYPTKHALLYTPQLPTNDGTAESHLNGENASAPFFWRPRGMHSVRILTYTHTHTYITHIYILYTVILYNKSITHAHTHTHIYIYTHRFINVINLSLCLSLSLCSHAVWRGLAPNHCRHSLHLRDPSAATREIPGIQAAKAANDGVKNDFSITCQCFSVFFPSKSHGVFHQPPCFEAAEAQGT